MYCQICKETYLNYHDHIDSKYHQRRLRASKANKFIAELVQLFHPNSAKADQPPKTKQIKKTSKRKNETKAKTNTINCLKESKITELQDKQPVPNNPKINNHSTNVLSNGQGTL